MAVNLIRRPEGLGEPLGRYSHVSIATGSQLVTVAGQVGIASSGDLPGDGSLGAQVEQAYRNVRTALESAGATFGDVIRMTTFLVGADKIEGFMAARTAVFKDIFPDGNYPPNTLLVVSRLVEERFDVEIEAMAVIEGSE